MFIISIRNLPVLFKLIKFCNSGEGGVVPPTLSDLHLLN